MSWWIRTNGDRGWVEHPSDGQPKKGFAVIIRYYLADGSQKVLNWSSWEFFQKHWPEIWK